MAIYVELLSQAMAPVESMIFVDDRLKNLGAAAAWDWLQSSSIRPVLPAPIES